MAAQHTAFSLRPVVSDDAPRIAELIGDWGVARWLSSPPYPYRVADAMEFLRKLPELLGPNGRFEVVEIDGKLAGIVSIEPRSRGMEIAYWLGRPYWGRGIMTRAAKTLTQDFFANLRETKLNSGYFSGNIGSWLIQRRLGFEATCEVSVFNRAQGKPLSLVQTVLTRSRFEATQHRTM